MKIKGSRIIALAVLVAVVLLVAFKLKGNKQRVHDEVAFSQRKVENIPVSIETVKKGTLSENVWHQEHWKHQSF